MSDCLILGHSQGRYLADNLQDDSIDVVYESGADLDRLRQLVPSDFRKYKVRDFFSFFCYKTSIRGFANNTGAVQHAHPRRLISVIVIRFWEVSYLDLR